MPTQISAGKALRPAIQHSLALHVRGFVLWTCRAPPDQLEAAPLVDLLAQTHQLASQGGQREVLLRQLQRESTGGYQRLQTRAALDNAPSVVSSFQESVCGEMWT